MRAGFNAEHWTDQAGNPAGGCTYGTGFTISWQNGQLGRGNDRKAPNGAFVEDIIAAAADRIGTHQKGKFNCPENDKALQHLALALEALESRTKAREARQVEGTHQQ